MLEAVLMDEGKQSITSIARNIGTPVATAHRQVHSLIAERFLSRTDEGYFIPGPRLVDLMGKTDERQAVVSLSAPVLYRLSVELQAVVQLGTLDDQMVTYRIKTGPNSSELFTKTDMQLEAYCSGIGKALLAALPERELQAYLADGPFPPLTERTITNPTDLREELHRIRERGYATDDGEIAIGLRCLALPIRGPDGRTLAAISASRIGSNLPGDEFVLERLRAAAQEIEAESLTG